MNENVNVCITPKGDKPVLHFSQFDNERIFTVTVFADDGESAAVLTGLDIEFRLRKTDSHVVTIAPESVTDNVITFKTTEQMCACCGQNIASVVLMKDDMIISTLDILVDIQRDILSGGLTSESDIRNLTTQIEQIVPEVIGDDYYNKQEIDDLFAEHTIDPDDYYDKSDVDTLLSAKADASSVYTKGETDTLLSSKADASDVYTKGETNTLLSAKADSSDVYTKTQVDNKLLLKLETPVELTSADTPDAVIQFTGAADNVPMSSLKVDVAAGQTQAVITRCNSNIVNFPAYARSTASAMTIETTPDGAFHYYGQPSVAYCQLTTSFNVFIPAGVTITVCRDQSVAYQHYLSVTAIDDSVEYIRILANTTSVSATLTKAVKKIELVCLNLTVGADYDETIKFWVVIGPTDRPYQKYNGMTKTITFGQTLALSGSLDCISGLLTLSDDSTIQCDGIELDSISGINTVFSDSGDVTQLKFLAPGCEELFRYIRLIKG